MVYNYHMYPKDSLLTTDKGFLNFDNESLDGTPLTCFYIKDNKSFYFDSFGGAPQKFLLTQLQKPLNFCNFEIQDIYSRFCGAYCS